MICIFVIIFYFYSDFVKRTDEDNEKRKEQLGKLNKLMTDQTKEFKTIIGKQNDEIAAANEEKKVYDNNFFEIEKTAKRHEQTFKDLKKLIETNTKNIKLIKDDNKNSDSVSDELKKELKKIEIQTVGYKWKQLEIDIKYYIGESITV